MWEKEQMLVTILIPNMFSKAFFVRAVKRCSCVMKGNVIHLCEALYQPSYYKLWVHKFHNFYKRLNSYVE